MRVLVTGGAGFIGSHLVDALLTKGHDVRVLDDFSSGKFQNLRGVRREVQILKGDCADLVAARKAAKGVEVVFHEGAMPSVGRSVEQPARSHKANATATLHMLVAARDAGVRRFIYAGSSSVYGDSKVLPKHERLQPEPRSPYAVGKLVGEHYVRIFASLYGLETVTLRYFNVFGPRQDPGSPYSGVISLFTTCLLTGRTPVIYGDGRQTRDFTYVGNVVDANMRALTATGIRGQSVNVATGKAVSLRELLKKLAEMTERSPRAQHRAARPGDVRHSLADIRLARRLLGYVPKVSFEEGLARTLEWYRGSI